MAKVEEAQLRGELGAFGTQALPGHHCRHGGSTTTTWFAQCLVPLISPLARDGEGLADAVSEQRQPFDRLVAKHEADVPIGDLAAPATHRRRRDLLLEQAIGGLDAVEP